MRRRHCELGVVALLLASCGIELGDSSDWVAWDAIEGDLRPELVNTYSPDTAPERLRIVSYNVKLGSDPEGFAREILDNSSLAAADVLLLQEIESHPREGPSRAATMAAELSMNYAYAPARTEGKGTHGLAILSRHPLGELQIMQLPFADRLLRARRRIAMAATVDIGGEPVRVINIHLDVRLNIARRIEQMHPVTETSPERVVIAGDFNTNPHLWAKEAPILPDQAVADLDQAEMLDDYMRAYGFQTPTADSGPTQDSVVTRLRLDAIFTRDLVALDAEVVKGLSGSDHWPLLLDVEWPP